MKRLQRAAVLALGTLALAGAAQAMTVTEGVFTGWDQQIAGLSGGTSTIAIVASGGVGGTGDPYVQIDNNTPGVASTVWAGLTSPETYVAIGGALDFLFSVQVAPNVNPGGDHNAYGLLIAQGDGLFLRALGVTGTASGWREVTGSGTLESGDFSLLSGTGALDLSQPFHVGFGSGNSRSGLRGSGWDSFSLSGIETVAAPLPPAAALLAAGLAALGLRRGRRKG